MDVKYVYMFLLLRACWQMIQTLSHNSVLWLSSWHWLYFQMFCFGFKKKLMSYCICVLCSTMNLWYLYSLIFFGTLVYSLYNFPLLNSKISSHYNPTGMAQVVKALVLEVCFLQGPRFNTTWVHSILWGY